LKADILIADFSYEEEVEQPNHYSVQLDENKHIILSHLYLQYVNHSCSPNVFFDTTAMELKTLQPIQASESLRFFYPSTERKIYLDSRKTIGFVQIF
jgi:hypothetical protein